jgi:hypothetical protein
MPHRLSRAERTLEFLAMSLILYLGPRRSDVIKFGLGDVRNQVIHFRIEKNNPRLRKELAIPIVPALDDVLKLASAARRHTSKPSMASRLRRPALAIGFATCATGPFKDCRPWPPQGPPGHRLRERSNRPRIDGDRRARVGERDVALHRETRSRQACAERHEEARRGTSPERKFRT